MGGGRQQFLDFVPPNQKDYSCTRKDGRNLIAYWADEKWTKNATFRYVQNTEELLTSDLRNVEYLLGERW
jgi:alkaline phosphatase